MDYKRADSLLSFLSDAGRRELVALLAETPLTVGEIAAVLQLPQSTVSRHLKNLRATGLILDHREGSRLIIRLAEPSSNGQTDLADLLNQWIRRQPLSEAVRTRLEYTLSERSGGQDKFARLAHQWDELRCRYFGSQFHLEALCALLPSHWRVLDVGTGTGYLLPTLARNFREVIAVDPSPAMLQLAQSRVRQQDLKNVRFHDGRLEALPVPSESLDLALAILVLHHSESPVDALSELFRVLRPGGVLLLVDLMPHEREEFQREMSDPIRGLDPEMFTGLIRRVGFRDVATRRLVTPPAGLPGGPTDPAPELFLIRASKVSDSAAG